MDDKSVNNDNINSNEELMMEDELSSDFLQSIDRATIPPVKDIPSARQDSSGDQLSQNINNQPPQEVATPDQPVDANQAVDTEDAATTEALDNTDNDWIEDAKEDLPGQLALDIYETKDHLVVICRLAGVDEKNIDVSISADNILNIRGSLSPQIEDTIDNYYIQECYWGEFSRSISLPVDVKKDEIKATLEAGILKIIFIRIQQDVIQKIDINSR